MIDRVMNVVQNASLLAILILTYALHGKML